MYRVALIQNASEMLRYSWGDIRPMIQRLYAYDGYTAENLDELYARLRTGRYDAIVIASNACNDKALRESLVQHRQELDDFLRAGKGLLVSFQMKLSESNTYGFLPESAAVAAVGRIQTGERPQEGGLSVAAGRPLHTVLQFPNAIDIADISTHCLVNNMVQGLYWIYLLPAHPEHYETLIEDGSYGQPRALLISTREDLRFRIVVSALALDWQMHDRLWENAVRYVVEGRPSIAVLAKSSNPQFDFRYLVSLLQVGKVPHHIYSDVAVRQGDIAPNIHDTYVLDPAWSPDEVEDFVARNTDLVDAGRARIFYFGKTRHGHPIISAVSNVREYQVIARNAITWLVSRFPTDPSKGYWADSFWCTVDALQCLVEFGIPVAQFKDKILASINKHDKNGSYDEVLGATCAMLEVYKLFLGTDDDRTRNALRWVQAHVHDKTLFERATGYDTLARVGEHVDRNRLDDFRMEVMKSAPSLDNEFSIYRFARTLLTCGFADEAEKVVWNLRELQNPQDGRWVNATDTAALVELLIDIRQATKRLNADMDEMIFRAIQFVRASYTPELFSWNCDVSATAKATKALRVFEQGIRFPIDVTMAALREGDDRAQKFIAIDAASALNVKLQNQVNEATASAADLQVKVNERELNATKAARWIVALAVTVSVIMTFLLSFVGYLIEESLMGKAWTQGVLFLSKSAAIVVPSLAIIPLLILVYVLRRLGRCPAWLQSVLSHFIKSD